MFSSFLLYLYLSFSETRERAARQNCKGGRSIPVPADKNYMVNIRATTHYPPTKHHLSHFCETKIGWYQNDFFCQTIECKRCGHTTKANLKVMGVDGSQVVKGGNKSSERSPISKQKKCFHFLKKVKTK